MKIGYPWIIQKLRVANEPPFIYINTTCLKKTKEHWTEIWEENGKFIVYYGDFRGLIQRDKFKNLKDAIKLYSDHIFIHNNMKEIFKLKVVKEWRIA